MRAAERGSTSSIRHSPLVSTAVSTSTALTRSSRRRTRMSRVTMPRSAAAAPKRAANISRPSHAARGSPATRMPCTRSALRVRA
ncbi:hypothetical protein DEF24_17845 [Marinitenerispora sediminis]|uniref:Uncharacterized protein n=1 Tax=Marinitenerispora sediminis TaxID=1931232 RepID=A0A368T2D0_9ACTN|nr:hypothetical protein DEF24_17845 [Marinitenerispora sediminis]